MSLFGKGLQLGCESKFGVCFSFGSRAQLKTRTYFHVFLLAFLRSKQYKANYMDIRYIWLATTEFGTCFVSQSFGGEPCVDSRAVVDLPFRSPFASPPRKETAVQVRA